MTIFVKLPAGKNGVARAAVSHTTERVFYAARLLRLLDEGCECQNVRRKFTARALREACDMAEVAITLVESDITK